MATGSAQGRDAQLKAPDIRQLQPGPRPFFHDTIVRRSRVLALRGGFPGWGGTITASTGDVLTIYVSESYAASPETASSCGCNAASVGSGPALPPSSMRSA